MALVVFDVVWVMVLMFSGGFWWCLGDGFCYFCLVLSVLDGVPVTVRDGFGCF